MIVKAEPACDQALSFAKSTGYMKVEYNSKKQITQYLQ